MIKKVILELWCMSYGVGLFLLAWWKLMATAALVAALPASVLFAVKTFGKKRSRP